MHSNISKSFILLACLCAQNLLADTLETRSGEKIEGTFKSATATEVIFEVAGASLAVERSKVSAIYLGSGRIPRVRVISGDGCRQTTIQTR